MTSNQECYVYIVLPGKTEFTTAARFRLNQNREGEPIGEFIYSKNYLNNPDAVELDPVELKLNTKKFETARMNGFFGAIRDAMPDYWGRRVIERNAGLSILNEFDYLLNGPDDRAGALGFGLNTVPPSPRRQFNKTLDLENLQIISEKIINDDFSDMAEKKEDIIDLNQVQELLLEGTSMGGARPKAVLEHENSLWLAKFSTSHDRWNYPCVEHALLNLAKLCGLHVAKSKIVDVANKKVLLVKRFDREYAETGYFRHRMVSALTLLQSEENTFARNEWSYLLLADQLRHTSANPKSDLQELFGRMVFNALVSNLDDHPRNHALLAINKSWRLSPAYDLTPTPSFALDNRNLAMICGVHGRMANAINLVSGHGRFLLTKEEAEAIIEKMASVIRANWEACVLNAGVNHKEHQAISNAFLYPGFFNKVI
jgi:serine/threonine-protein kinase HipA